jgi:hypothetical protein
MKIRTLMFAGAGALALVAVSGSAESAAVVTGMKMSASGVPTTDQVQYRRCWNCRPYAPPYFYRGYPGPYDPYYYGPLYGYGPGYYGFHYGGDVRVYRGRYRRGQRRW